MPIYKIAGINVLMHPKYETLTTQSKPYLCDETTFDFEISLSDEYLQNAQIESPHLTLNDCEYIFTGALFYEKCLSYNCFLLHSSAVCVDNKAYLFSASSGIGKSTHVSLWLKAFENAFIINDDKPAIREIDNEFFVCGTPFSGKTDKNKNVSIPLQSICILNRGNENIIKKMPAKDAVLPILNQTVRPMDKMNELMAILTKLLSRTNIFSLHCNMDDEAAKISYKAMK